MLTQPLTPAKTVTVVVQLVMVVQRLVQTVPVDNIYLVEAARRVALPVPTALEVPAAVHPAVGLAIC